MQQSSLCEVHQANVSMVVLDLKSSHPELFLIGDHVEASAEYKGTKYQISDTVIISAFNDSTDVTHIII